MSKMVHRKNRLKMYVWKIERFWEQTVKRIIK